MPGFWVLAVCGFSGGLWESAQWLWDWVWFLGYASALLETGRGPFALISESTLQAVAEKGREKQILAFFGFSFLHHFNESKVLSQPPHLAIKKD